MPRIEIMRARALLLLSSFSEDFLRWGGKPPSKKEKARMPSQTPIIIGKEKNPMRKKGGRGSPPPAHSQFRLLPPPKQQKKFGTRSFELVVACRQ
jgi:hypothetical protein